MKFVSVYCQFPMLETIKDLGLKYTQDSKELRVICEDIEYDRNHYIQDPDEQYVHLLGLDWDLVNRVEADNFCAI